MANLTILRTYARINPTQLPASILFSHSDTTLTIYDAYPKSIFHLLVLPRVLPSLSNSSDLSSKKRANPSVSDLSSLRALLNSGHVTKEEAKGVILSLKEEAERAKAEIEQEMKTRYGFVWGVWIGFHGSPSMEHIHLHVLSTDLCSEKMKTKRHYNSFHPKLGFFLHVDELLSWFDAEPSYYRAMVKLPATRYEPLLKESLSCFHCKSEMKNMPTLKKHLQQELEQLETRIKRQMKRKLELDDEEQQAKGPTKLDRSSGISPAHKKTRKDNP